MKPSTPIVKHLVLIGGGHSHLFVLKNLGMNPVPGLAVTLITRDVVTPYSGSLPGFLAGAYDHDQMHIDLAPLAQFAGACLIQQEVTAIDLPNRTIRLDGRPAVQFDVLSLNTGSSPNTTLIPGAETYATGIKPIDTLIQRWHDISAQALSRLRQKQNFHLAIIGGGPASVEFALATQARINQELGLSADDPSAMQISLLTANKQLLLGHNTKVQRFAAQELEQRGINILPEHEVSHIESGIIHCADDKTITADAIVYATGASLPEWQKSLGLQLSKDGFIEVTSTLQSTSYDYVFAAGDAATIAGAPRPKSGVYAVRHGKVLAHNLLAYARGKRLRKYRPQQHALALMSLSNGKAIASRGQLFLQGKLAWHFKHRIDSAFLRKFSQLPEMKASFELSSGLVDQSTELQMRKHALRCAGCGAKVPAAILKEVLNGLRSDDDLPLEHLAQAEDAAIMELPQGQRLVQSVDLLKAFSNDPWIFARIATIHCLSDLHAMGVTADSAQAIVGLPPASSSIAKAQLSDLMHGCQQELLADHCELIGGHTAEAETLQFGLCVNALLTADTPLLTKTGVQEGNVLILTKALGTGTVLAAHMRYRARYAWLQACLASMLQSNRDAAAIFVEHQASACTDITGFGLAGHLLEMLGEQTQASLFLRAIKSLPGALECLRSQITSSLHADNSLAGKQIDTSEFERTDPQCELLFDPQTAGGLLASVPASRSEDCVAALQQAGYCEAVIIGEIRSTQGKPTLITLQ